MSFFQCYFDIRPIRMSVHHLELTNQKWHIRISQWESINRNYRLCDGNIVKQSCNDECLQSQTKCSNDQSTLKVTAALKYSTTLSPHWFLIFKIFLFKSSRPRNISNLNSSNLYWLPSLLYSICSAICASIPLELPWCSVACYESITPKSLEA